MWLNAYPLYYSQKSEPH